MSSADRNSSEARFLKGNAKKENETRPKHSKANILANIEKNISTSNNTEDVTYNHLEQIIDQNMQTSLRLAKQKISVFSKIIPQFSSFLPSSRILYLSCLTLFRKNDSSIRINQNKEMRQEFQNWLDARRNYNFFFYQLTNRNEELLYCDSTATLVVSEDKSFRKLWKDQDISKKSMIIIPFNPNNCHWILVVVSIKERAIAVMDPHVKNSMWADASVRKGVEVRLEIMRLKFNDQAQYMIKIYITHVKQPDAISCGAMVCYYAEKIISCNFFGCFTLHTSEAYSETS